MEVEGELRWSDLVDIFGEVVWKWESLFEDDSLNDGLDELEKVVKNKLLATLIKNKYCQKDTARELRISDRKINHLVRKYRINHPSWRREN